MTRRDMEVPLLPFGEIPRGYVYGRFADIIEGRNIAQAQVFPDHFLDLDGKGPVAVIKVELFKAGGIFPVIDILLPAEMAQHGGTGRIRAGIPRLPRRAGGQILPRNTGVDQQARLSQLIAGAHLPDMVHQHGDHMPPRSNLDGEAIKGILGQMRPGRAAVKETAVHIQHIKGIGRDVDIQPAVLSGFKTPAEKGKGIFLPPGVLAPDPFPVPVTFDGGCSQHTDISLSW